MCMCAHTHRHVVQTNIQQIIEELMNVSGLQIERLN